jgi:hypothetical protein
VGTSNEKEFNKISKLGYIEHIVEFVLLKMELFDIFLLDSLCQLDPKKTLQNGHPRIDVFEVRWSRYYKISSSSLVIQRHFQCSNQNSKKMRNPSLAKAVI